MIPVVRPYLPDKKKYEKLISKIFDSSHLTNQGRYLKELESRLSEYLNVDRLICVSSGSAALHLAYKIYGLKSKILTSPFSYVATSSTLVWDELIPDFIDIHPNSLNMHVDEEIFLKKANIEGVVSTLVYGNPHGLEDLKKECNKHNIPLIIDAAHAFGVRLNDRSVLEYCNAAALSFHATKIFHTIEGGALIVDTEESEQLARSYINFGIKSDGFEISGGTNYKMNEFEAAMGLCVLDDIDRIIEMRANISKRYNSELSNFCQLPEWPTNSKNNNAYAPIILESEDDLQSVISNLKSKGIQARRYFYPSLDTIGYTHIENTCEISRDIARRVLCLPIYPQLKDAEVSQIIYSVKEALSMN